MLPHGFAQTLYTPYAWRQYYCHTVKRSATGRRKPFHLLLCIRMQSWTSCSNRLARAGHFNYPIGYIGYPIYRYSWLQSLWTTGRCPIWKMMHACICPCTSHGHAYCCLGDQGNHLQLMSLTDWSRVTQFKYLFLRESFVWCRGPALAWQGLLCTSHCTS